MASVELGTFIAFLAVPFLTVIFMGKIRAWGFQGYILFLAIGALSFIMLGGLTLMFASGYEVVQSQASAAYNSTQIMRDANGTVTGTVETQVPQTTKQIPIIADYQQIWAWICFAFMIVFGMLYFYVMITGGTGN